VLYQRGQRATPLDLVWDFGDSTIMATWEGIHAALEHGKRIGAPNKKLRAGDITGIKNYLVKGTKKDGQWLRKFKELLDTEKIVGGDYDGCLSLEKTIDDITAMTPSERTFDQPFDEVERRLSYFVVRTPLTNQNIIASVLQRVAGDGTKVASVQSVVDMGVNGLQKCSCKTWIHYTWCKHSAADARRKGIINMVKKNDPNRSKAPITKAAQELQRRAKKRNKKSGRKGVLGGGKEKVKSRGGSKRKKARTY